MNAERRLAEIDGYVNPDTGRPRADIQASLEAMRHAEFVAWSRSPRCRRCHWPDEYLAFGGDLCPFCLRHVSKEPAK